MDDTLLAACWAGDIDEVRQILSRNPELIPQPRSPVIPDEFHFGDGLSYTTFKYYNMQISKLVLDATQPGGDSLFVTVDVTNTGKVAARHVVMLFLYDLYRRVTPEYKLLRHFQSIFLQPGEKQIVLFTLSTPNDFEYVGVDSHYIMEGGNYMIGLHPSVDCRAPPDLW
eukprot:gene47580-61859_t